MADTAELTQEEKQWFDSPVDVRVEQDNTKWLDAMMEMKPDELRSYGTYQYGIPEAAAAVLDRQQLIEMIVRYNASGQTAPGSTERYRYIPQLAGILPPVVKSRSKHGGSGGLYKTRGKGKAMQVLDVTQKDEQTGQKGVWVPFEELRKRFPKTGSVQQEASAAPGGVPMSMVLPLIDKASRSQLETICASIGVHDATDQEKYPNNESLRVLIREYAEVTGGTATESEQ